ncbi:hypothetical protein AAZX31_06G008400 [Glycine max]|nr:hypothetical protein GYH30_013708 [Glycine max]
MLLKIINLTWSLLHCNQAVADQFAEIWKLKGKFQQSSIYGTHSKGGKQLGGFLCQS